MFIIRMQGNLRRMTEFLKVQYAVHYYTERMILLRDLKFC